MIPKLRKNSQINSDQVFRGGAIVVFREGAIMVLMGTIVFWEEVRSRFGKRGGAIEVFREGAIFKRCDHILVSKEEVQLY